MKDLLERARKIKRLLEGGAGSGNFGHAGRPGERGGSGEGGGGTGDVPTFDSVKSTMQAEFDSKGKRGDDKWYVYNAEGRVIGPKYSLANVKLIGKQTLVVKVYSDYVRMLASGAMDWGKWHQEHISSIQKAVPGAEVSHSGRKVNYIHGNPDSAIDTYRVRSPKPLVKSGNESLHKPALSVLKEGGEGSGNFGHAGRPGERGGSSGEGDSTGESGSKTAQLQTILKDLRGPDADYTSVEVGLVKIGKIVAGEKEGVFVKIQAILKDLQGPDSDYAAVETGLTKIQAIVKSAGNKNYGPGSKSFGKGGGMATKFNPSVKDRRLKSLKQRAKGEALHKLALSVLKEGGAGSGNLQKLSHESIRKLKIAHTAHEKVILCHIHRSAR